MGLAVILALSFGVWGLICTPWILAFSKLKKGEAREALRLFRRFAPLYNRLGEDNRAMLTYNTGICLLQLGERNEAFERLKESLELLQGSKDRRLRTYKAMAPAICALFYAEDGELEEAKRLAESAQEQIDSKAPIGSYTEAILAGVSLYEERFEEAEAELKRILESRPEPHEATKTIIYALLGICVYFQGRVAEALEHQNAGAQCVKESLYQQSSFLSNQLGYVIELGDMAKAQQIEAKLIPALQKLEEAQRSHPYRALSALAITRSDLDRALDYAERSCNQNVSKRELANSLHLQAQVYAQRKNYARALQLIEEAETYPNFTQSRERLAKLRREVEAANAPQISAASEAPVQQITA